MNELILTRHPDTRSEAVLNIRGRVRRSKEGLLAVTYVLEGELDRVRMPAPRQSGIGDRLWQHTCCEIFIARAGLPGYHEFNFAPSGDWDAYAFPRYREGARLAHDELDPQVVVRRAAAELELDALIRLDRLSPMHPGARLSLALSAVIEDMDGALSYWAFRHAPGKPDFHHPDGFALVLE